MKKNYVYNLSLDGLWRLYIEENRLCKAYADAVCKEADLVEKGLRPIDGTVPGNFELDMQRAGLIDDLFYDTNVIKAQELENRHLWYCREFDFNCFNDEAELNFDGIDTIADVYLNGELIGSADNMFISHSYKVSPRHGKNELMVHIKPVCIEARNNVFEAGVLSSLYYNQAGVTIRKANHMFGWDIMPRIVSAGIWKSVSLRVLPENGIDEMYLIPTKARDGGSVHVYCRMRLSEDDTRRYKLVIKGTCGDSTFTYERVLFHNEIMGEIWFENPKPWWPRGMGEQNLYSIEAVLYLDGRPIDTVNTRMGLRTVELHNTEVLDKDGKGEFRFYVNGEPMYARGTNWVPLDAFHSRDPERLPAALGLLYDSGCNFVRVWGGNVYESDEFYDYCDEKGICVWQDFCMGCSFYPQTDEFAAKLREEAVSVVKRLREHCSLVLWAGDNECDLAIREWHSGRHFNPNDNLLTRKVLPEVVRNYDPYREYLPSSPYLSPLAYARGGDTPENHSWGPRGYYKDDFYKRYTGFFVSEIGYHGCPSVESVKKFIAPENLWPYEKNRAWLSHAACMEPEDGKEFSYRIPLMASQIVHLFGARADNLEEFSVLSQIVQSEADKYFLETNRMSRNIGGSGMFYWNVVDGWPQFSDAVVDYYGDKKLAYYSISRCFQTVAFMIGEPDADGYSALCCDNDSLKPVSCEYRVTRLSDGKTVSEGTFESSANSLETVAKLRHESEKEVYKIEWKLGGEWKINHYVHGLPPFEKQYLIDAYKKLGLIK